MPRRWNRWSAQGSAGSLTELADRFVIAHPAVSTMLVGYSTLDQLEEAIAAVNKGPLPAATLGASRLNGLLFSHLPQKK